MAAGQCRAPLPPTQAVASGAIASDYQRTRVERVCARLGLVSLAYLWQQPQAPLLQRMVGATPAWAPATCLLPCKSWRAASCRMCLRY